MRREVRIGDRRVVLLGTAHVSEQSVSEVEDAIEDIGPDRVCVELDEQRLRSLRDKDVWKDRDVADVISRGDGHMLLFNVLLSIYQRKLGEDLDIAPGAEMLAAVEAAEEQGVPVELIDRDINITLKRAMDRFNLLEKGRLLSSAVEGFFADAEEVSVEDLKQKDVLHEVVAEFSGRFPHLKEVFIDERDTYMAEKLRLMEADTVLAVVGAGHVEGIAERLEEGTPRDTEELETVDPGFDWMKAVKYALPVAIVAMFGYGVARAGTEVAREMLFYWFALNGTGAALGAAVAGASIVTIAVSFVAAPFTSVNPAMPAGLVAAYAENRVRKPRVEDMESIGEISRYRDLWHNRATRLLLIFFLVNLGSAIATFTGAAVIARLAGLV
ncbi:MAG: TraB/GumN family protein [Candidatus Nanohaloarchaea archaeon]|nr:TraB/GumN family protein [Candidatus Nanohaloarchaea archaeon]